MLNRSLVLCVLLLVFGTYSKACSCAGFGPACVEAVSPEVSVVFLGTVVAVGPSSRTPQSNVFGDMLDVTLSVEESYKGASSKQIVVTTASSESACGFPFKKGERYVVYASEYERKLFTSICQRTLPAKVVEKDLDYLRKLATAGPTVLIGGSYKQYTFDPHFVPKFTPSIMDHYRPAAQLTNATLRYFSGATSPQSAKKIKIGFGQHVGSIELRIPFDLASWKNIKGSN